MSLHHAQFRPCIDLHDGRVKQIVGSTLQDTGAGPATNCVSDRTPGYYAMLYRDLQLPGGHVIQLGKGNEAAAKEALSTWPGGLQLGGGVNPDNAPMWLDAGASHVIVTSYIFEAGQIHWNRLNTLISTVGKDKLVLDLSCRKRDGKYYIVTDRWQKFTSWEISGETLEKLADHAAEFLIHAVDVEGKQQGIDLELLALLAEKSPIDCVYAGGIATLEDIDRIEKYGSGRIHYTIGSALDIFGGQLALADVSARHHANRTGTES